MGRIKCGFCGSNITTAFTGKDENRHFYYKCNRKYKRGSENCEARDIPANEIEQFVENLVIQIASSDVMFESVFSQLGENEKKDVGKFDDEKKLLKSNLREVKKKIDNFLRFISKGNTSQIKSITDGLENLQN